jgi:four helix bundle protein
MGYESFKELKVWQEAKSLAIDIYKITNQGMLKTDYGLRDQIQKSAVSIASNIAEGYERNSDKDFLRFLYIAKGSLSELLTQLEIASGVGYLLFERKRSGALFHRGLAQILGNEESTNPRKLLQ